MGPFVALNNPRGIGSGLYSDDPYRTSLFFDQIIQRCAPGLEVIAGEIGTTHGSMAPKGSASMQHPPVVKDEERSWSK